jgi:CheY-like chemotaxis protein
MRILIIDDDDDIRGILDLVLGAQGYEVVTAADGLAGLEQLRVGGRPSLILLDMMMPRLDGEGFLRAMRSNPHTADIPVIIVTGHPAAHEKAAQLGTAGCLVKPVELAELLSTIARLNSTRVLPR